MDLHFVFGVFFLCVGAHREPRNVMALFVLTKYLLYIMRIVWMHRMNYEIWCRRNHSTANYYVNDPSIDKHQYWLIAYSFPQFSNIGPKPKHTFFQTIYQLIDECQPNILNALIPFNPIRTKGAFVSELNTKLSTF